ncbi:hypothetical protein N865_02005 [Intrasporangium oryzae NRRL B-24470]|uniref:Uncharacterized protein n=1 Tax=Intrasporangium oryzae NRRL B-24470 TaxID=1386089 RepID=W9GEE9_9MICO|nr:hypothetical protein N865_02005 [Intrasporangium oryzae NRRL B-24470]
MMEGATGTARAVTPRPCSSLRSLGRRTALYNGREPDRTRQTERSTTTSTPHRPSTSGANSPSRSL